MVLQIKNRDARLLWLELQAMCQRDKDRKAAPNRGTAAPQRTHEFGSKQLLEIIHSLGFVQLDSIQITARAHHHILWSRNHRYREYMLDDLISERKVFEHFTHDASVLPMAFYPYWASQFKRLGNRANRTFWGKHLPPPATIEEIYKRIKKEGPLCSRDFKGKADKSVHLWMRPPHKLALDFMWFGGRLATSHRHNFQKYYDIKSNIIPPSIAAVKYDLQTRNNWLCVEALKRLGFATYGEIQKFWDVVPLDDVKKWVATSREIIEVEVQGSDKTYRRYFALKTIKDKLANRGKLSPRLHILNPFDPLIRDRKRLAMLFGFDFKIEIFTPAAKRQYGYYICPLLDKDKFIGRIEVRVDRKKKILRAENIWVEAGQSLSQARMQKLTAELNRMARFTGAHAIEKLL